MEVRPVVLEGKRLRLEPLEERHADGLWKLTDPELFRYMTWWSHESVQKFRELVKKNCNRADAVGFAMVDKVSGELVGSSTYLDIRPEHRSLEIGATWIGRAHQGTRINPEAKLLMLEHAFEELRCIRVQLKTDARNLHSRRAMEKLGAKPEGVLRAHMICRDGYLRDSAMYSIVEDEWPDVRDGLMQRLAALK